MYLSGSLYFEPPLVFKTTIRVTLTSSFNHKKANSVMFEMFRSSLASSLSYKINLSHLIRWSCIKSTPFSHLLSRPAFRRCDECHKRYHFTCLEPPLNKNPKKRGYSWHCADCDPTVSDYITFYDSINRAAKNQTPPACAN